MRSNSKPVPIRDLSEEDQRGLVGNVVTVKVYEDLETQEPSATLHGRLALIALTPDGTVVVFEYQPNFQPVPASQPITVEW